MILHCANLLFKLFPTKIRPSLLDGSEPWGRKFYLPMERVHTFALKKLLNVSQKTINMVYGDIGGLPISVHTIVSLHLTRLDSIVD